MLYYRYVIPLFYCSEKLVLPLTIVSSLQLLVLLQDYTVGCCTIILRINDSPLINIPPGVCFVRGRFLADVQKRS